MSTTPELILGTAMWGWTTPASVCFDLLDHFYEQGFRAIDTATNYPINENTADFRLAEKILKEWIHTNGITDLKVMVKVGSITNIRTSENNLQKSFLLMLLDEYQFLFGENLETYMIHWDNREASSEVRASLEAMTVAAEKGFQIGLSGIKHPSIYQALQDDFPFDFRIQIKHNLLQSSYEHYKAFHGKPRFIAYGINAGGIKLAPDTYHEQSSLKVRGGNIQVEPALLPKLRDLIQEVNQTINHPITHFNECGMTYAFHSPDMEGILLGTSKLEQLKASIAFYHLLCQGKFEAFHESLVRLKQSL